MSNPGRRRGWWVAAGLTIVLAAGLRTASFSAGDPDLGLHLAVGRHMVEHEAFPERDPFTYTTAKRRFLNFEWGFDLAAYLLYREAGPKGLVAARLLLVGALLALTVLLAGRLGGGARRAGSPSPTVAALLLLAALPVMRIRLVDRPHLVGLLLIMLHLYAARRLAQSEGRRQVASWAALLAGTVPLWAAMHGSWPLALVISGAHMLFDRGRRRRFLSLGVIQALALLANPYGPALLLVPFRHIGSDVIGRYITEWMSPEVMMPAGHAAVALGIATAFACAAALRRRRGDAPEVLLGLLLLLLASRAFRFVTPALLVCIPPLADRLAAAISGLRTRRLRSTGVIGLALLGGGLFTGLIDHQIQPFPSGWGWETIGLPRAATSTLTRAGLPGPLFNDFDVGGDLCWTLGSRVPHTIDGRVDLFGEEQIEAYRRAVSDPAAFEAHRRRFGVQLALLGWSVPRNARLISHLMSAPDWALVHLDEAYGVWATGEARRRAREAGLVLRRIRPARDPRRLLTGPADGELVREVERVAGVARSPFRELLEMEAGWRRYSKLADPASLRAVVDAADRALAGAPGLVFARFRRGQARLRLGDARTALPDLLAAALSARTEGAWRELKEAMETLPAGVRLYLRRIIAVLAPPSAR